MTERPSTYRKLVVRELGTDFRAATEIVEVPLPEPGPDETLLRVLYAGVNASDILRTNGGYDGSLNPPFDVGVEGVGEVVAVGANVTMHQVGQIVAASDLEGGFYGEYKLVSGFTAFPVPEAKPEYAAFLATGISAAAALDEAGKMTTGEVVLVTAAAGSAGSWAVQLAKAAGNRVIGACGSDDKFETLRTIGCDAVLNYRDGDFSAALAEAAPDGVDIVFESVGGDVFEACVDNLAPKGRIIVFGAIDEYADGAEATRRLPVSGRILHINGTIQGFTIMMHPEATMRVAPQLIGGVFTGAFSPVVDPVEFKGVDAVVDAVEYVHARRNCGKVVIRIA